MDISDMISSQSAIFEILKQNKKKDRLSHAYLFYGEEGVGKKEMAYALACLLYCEHDGCLSCPTCQTILNGNHMNVEYIGIESTKKLISKEQILSLQEEFSKTSLVEGPRVYIVDGIDTASSSAQNSLLKFIEEPTNQAMTVGIFIAKDLSGVVPTIVSRCALFHFPSIDTKLRVELITERNVLRLDAVLAAFLTNDISEAEQLVQGLEFMQAKEFFLKFLSLKNEKEAVLFYLQNASLIQNASAMNMFFRWLVGLYEDLLNPEELLFQEVYDRIKVVHSENPEELMKQFSLVLKLSSKMEYNVSSKNVFHELMTKLF